MLQEKIQTVLTDQIALRTTRVGATMSPGIDKPLVGPAGKPYARPSASPSREGIYRDGTGWRHLEARLQQAPRRTWPLYPRLLLKPL